MKKINIELSTRYVDEAINYLKKVRQNFRRMMDEFLEFACLWIIDRANQYVELSDIGSLVKMQIRNSWEYNISNGVATVQNTATMQKRHRKAATDIVPVSVLVEFGVGVVGQSSPHPNSAQEGYEYNVPSDYKSSDGTWYFWTNSNELDLPLSAVEDIKGFDDFRGVNKEQGKRIVVGTKGAKGVMYAYNAIVDANVDLQNPNGDFAKEWAKIKERYMV